MPWKATDELKERTRFVLEWERRWNEAAGGFVNMAELCRMFGISRQTGYAVVQRYRDGGHDLAAIAPRSKRPKSSPTAISPELEDLVVAARKMYPRWGPRKLHAMLVERNPGKLVPSASVMAKILKRRGLTATRKRRRRAHVASVASPFVGCTAPNDVWCIDFKGWFRTLDGIKCYPLTLIDAFSRMLLRCEALTEPDGKQVLRILDSAFVEYGLPKAMRSDGGPPFASTGPARLTELSVWLLRLGLQIEIIAPGKPQQNGRLERLHRTLKADTAMPPETNCIAQQRRFDVWRGQYNHIRPHEALDMRCPGDVYHRSHVTYPRPLLQHTCFEPFSRVARLDRSGAIKWQRRNVLISSALKHEQVEIEPDPHDEARWTVRWGTILLGYLDDERFDRGLIVPRRERGARRELSRMSLY